MRCLKRTYAALTFSPILQSMIQTLGTTPTEIVMNSHSIPDNSKRVDPPDLDEDLDDEEEDEDEDEECEECEEEEDEDE
jgi:hypothetical protein